VNEKELNAASPAAPGATQPAATGAVPPPVAAGPGAHCAAPCVAALLPPPGAGWQAARRWDERKASGRSAPGLPPGSAPGSCRPAPGAADRHPRPGRRRGSTVDLAHPASAPPPERCAPVGFSWRAVALGALLIPVSDAWIMALELRRYSFPTWAVPFYNVVVILGLLVGVNTLVGRLRPRWRFTAAELLTVYVMLSIASALMSVDVMSLLVSTIAHPYWFSTSRSWEREFLPLLPRWTLVSDRSALAGYYYGQSSLYRWEHLRAWAAPVAVWTLFLLLFMGTLLCLVTLVRRRWMQHERLTYPIIQLPLAMVTGEGGFWRDPVMWSGFALAAGISLLNGLNALVPAIPAIPVKRQDVGVYFVTPPWNAMGSTQLSFYPFAIGLGYLMPLELSTSCWVFYGLLKAQLVTAAATGWAEDRKVPYPFSQAFGAYLGIFVVALGPTARHLRRSLSAAGRPDADPELRAARRAAWGAGAGFAALVGFAAAGGMAPWFALLFFGLVFAFAAVATRIRAELGFPVHDMYLGSQHPLGLSFGSEAMGARNVAWMGLLYWMTRRSTAHPMPHQLEGYKVADRTGIAHPAMTAAILIATVVGIPAAFWTFLHNVYRDGAASAHFNTWTWRLGDEAFQRAHNWLQSPVLPDPTATLVACGGFAATLGMAMLRARVPWFPFHPLGYAVSSSWGMGQLWSCMLVASVAKGLTLHAGLNLYRRITPFFLGLLLGDLLAGGLWTIAGLLLNVQTYDFWP
jgi:Family of unknown function (DUF6785)/Domain of unknown function (DUF6784)